MKKNLIYENVSKTKIFAVSEYIYFNASSVLTEKKVLEFYFIKIFEFY